jgi:mobilization protein
MSQISSINFKKSIAINTAHNDRTLAPSYLISDRGVECDRPDEQARELKEQIIARAKETYTSRTGQRFQAKTYEWSAVCNIKPDTTMDDLKRLAQHFSDKYSFQCYQIAIHRDEGHIGEDGKEQINHHAHLEFIMLDKNTGVNCFKMRDFPKSKMREIQSEVSQILQMQRGEDKRKSGRQRTEPRQYAKQKEAEKKAIKTTQRDTEKEAIEAFKAVSESEEKLLNQKEKAEYLEQLRMQYKGKGLSAAFFRELGAIKKDKETQYTQKELDEAVKKAIEADREKQKPINRQEFEQQTTKELKAYTEDQKPIISPFLQSLITLLPKDSETIKQLEEELKKEKTISQDYKDFKKERNEQILKITKEMMISTENFKTYDDYDNGILKAIDILKRENDTLKTQNKALQEQNDIKDKEIITLKQENATAVKFEDLKEYFNLINYRASFKNERPNTISGDFSGKDREIDAKYSQLPLFDELIKPSVLLAKKAHLEIMQEKERQKAVSQKIIKKDTGRSF